MKTFGALHIHNYKPTIIAEAGVNHSCNLKLALKYVELAKKSGADAIKFQTYKAEKIVAKFSPAYWDTTKEKTKSQFELFKKYDKFDYNDYFKIYRKCIKEKILFMSSLFDTDAVDEYDHLLKVYKISSSDINNVPLLKKISSKKKFTIISTGGSSINEIKKAIYYLDLPAHKVCIMHCILNYPAKAKDAKLNYLKYLKTKFPNHLIGYSDHVNTNKELIQLQVAYEFGAQIIEKHFTHNKNNKGNDHYHSMDYKDLLKFNDIMRLRSSLIGVGKKNLNKEKVSIKYARRSIFCKKNIAKNEILSEKNLITLRPGNGISASNWLKVIGKKSKYNLEKGRMIKHKDFI
jgi:N-acetylneuraminate synthase